MLVLGEPTDALTGLSIPVAYLCNRNCYIGVSSTETIMYRRAVRDRANQALALSAVGALGVSLAAAAAISYALNKRRARWGTVAAALALRVELTMQNIHHGNLAACASMHELALWHPLMTRSVHMQAMLLEPAMA